MGYCWTGKIQSYHLKFLQRGYGYYIEQMLDIMIGIVLVFDLNDPSSLDNMKAWLESISIFQTQEVVKVIFANKSDLEQKVTEQELRQLETEHGVPVYSMSAKTNENINEAFLYLARQIKDKFFTKGKALDESDKKIFESDEQTQKQMLGDKKQEEEKKCC